MANLLYVLTTGGLLLTAFLLFTKPPATGRYANRWLAVFLLALTAVFLDDCFVILKANREVPFSSEFLGLFILSVGPAFYLSVRAYTSLTPIRLRANLIHFAPFLLFLVMTILLLLLDDRVMLNMLKQAGTTVSRLITLLILGFNGVQLVAYCYLSLRLIDRHRLAVTTFASSPDVVDLSWLRYFLYGVSFLVLVWLTTLLLPELTAYVTSLYFAGAYYLAYFALNQREIFPFSEADKTAIADVIDEATNPRTVREEPKKALLPPDERADAKERLLASMQTDQCYLDNELTLPKLAGITQLSIHKLSYLLNNEFGQNFYQFVNGYRIEEAKRLLLDPKKSHLSMEGIAYEAGFNSKTAFNTTFRKITGLSPTEFKISALSGS
ncbi:helix-turn-helix domain-containing protein [Nostoc sp. CHAB 5834]|nr:helix-turn-helix domain-containing protein [Nostoc sp. CHAB 5834]